MVAKDFTSYMWAQEEIDTSWKDTNKWIQMSLSTTLGMGKFSSDRMVQQYAKEIWRIEPSSVRNNIKRKGQNVSNPPSELLKK